MTSTRRHARPLLTDAEYELFAASFPDGTRDMTAAELRKAITRTRRLRDKARDLHRRQAVSVTARAGARGGARTANQRTARKEIVLAEALARYEKRLGDVERAAEQSRRAGAVQAKRSRGSGPSRGNRAARRAAKGKGRAATGGKFMSGSAQAESVAARRGPQIRISASRAAAGRRGQAKRDGR